MKRKSKADFRLIAKQVAVCAAMLALLMGTVYFWPASEENYITAPGLITVRAHEVDDTGNATIESVVLEQGVKFTPEYIFNPGANYQPSFPISFDVQHELYQGMQISFEVNTNAGIFEKHLPGDLSHVDKSLTEQYLYYYFGQHFTVDADTTIYWKPLAFDYEYMRVQFEKGNNDLSQTYRELPYPEGPVYVDIIIRAANHIVGYCVIEITVDSAVTGVYANVFSFEIVSMISFPQVNGQWQNVTDQYVYNQIQKTHLENES
jgi:hypothetical protein